MGKIKTYQNDNNINPNDKVLGSDADDNNKTKNYTIEKITEYINSQIGVSPSVSTPPSSGSFAIDLSNFLGTDYSGSTTSLTSLSVSSNAVQSGFARVKGNWSTQPTFTGATEAENSSFTADTVIYLYVEKWSDGVIYWYSEN